LEEVQERKFKKKGAYYNYGIRGHLQKECHTKNKTKITNSKVLQMWVQKTKQNSL
jgi:hypothetical protein